MALEKRPLVDVQVPIGDADGEMAQRIGGDVDAAGKKTVALHRREGSIVPDDLGDRIRRRHVASPRPSYETHGRTDSRVGLTPHAGPARRPAADDRADSPIRFEPGDAKDEPESSRTLERGRQHPERRTNASECALSESRL